MPSTRIHRLTVLLAVVLLGPWIAPTEAQRYHTRTYQEADGLPSTTVRGAIQDDTGRLWFATRAGVASYDGGEWVHYSRTDGLLATDYGHVIRSPGGRLWAVNTITPIQISQLIGDRWTPLPSHDTTPPNQWITTAAVSIHDGLPFVLVGTETGQLFLWNGSQWRVVHAADGHAPWRQRAVLAHGGGFLVAASDGLRSFDPRDATSEPALLDGVPFDVTLGVENDAARRRLWVVGEDAIGILENGRFETLLRGHRFELLPEFKGVVARADSRGGLYFGNPAGLFYFDPELGLEHLDRDNGLIAEGVTDILIDRENNVWVTGLRGITKIVSRRFANYNRDQGLFADEVTATLERRSGELVLGHGGGLTFLHPEPRTLLFEEDDLHGRVLDLAEDSNGTLWVAAAWRGLAAVAADGAFTWFGPEHGLVGGVLSVRFDERGELWVGTGTGLLARRNGRFEKVSLPIDEDEMAPHVRRVYEGPSGTIYAATKLHGVFRVTSEDVARAMHPTEPEANNVYAVLERGPDTWLGTNVGLFCLTEDGIGRLNEDGPKIERPVYFMVQDDDGRVWFGTDNGVQRWDGLRLDRFTVNEGLIGSETNRAAGLVDRRGRVWIGTDRGVSVYDPEFDSPRPVPPTVELLGALVGERSLILTEDHFLPHDQNELIYRFRAISFIDEERVRFRYRLEGLESEWRGPQEIPTRRIRYTNLSPGAYRLHLQAIDAEGGIGQEVVSAEIKIARPFWARTWFVMLMLVAFVGAVWAAMSHVEQLRYARRLEQEVQVRTEELRQSEARLAADRERLAVTLASITDGVVTIDEAGTVALWNRAAEKITGWPAEEAVGRPLNAVLGVDREGYAVLQSVIDNPPRVDSVSTRSRDGEQYLLEVSAALLGTEAKPSGHVLAFRDVTDRQRVEAELSKARKLEALGLLAGGIAHDFNNLLMVVLGNLSLAEMTEGIAEQVRDKLKDASSASLKARSLTQQLLTFSRGGAPVRHAASIGDVIRESAKFSLSGSSARCEIEIPDDLRVVEIDEGQMSQVLHNLLINARQAMPRGGTVRIRVSNLDAPPTFLPGGPYVLIEVEDNGVGIAEDNIDRVFDPYFSTKIDGSGLGLATAYSVVSRHDGLLTVDSVEGQGSVFKIYLPASKRPAAEVRAQSNETSARSGRVLLMDDDESVRRVVLGILEHYGFDAAGATDGEEAIALYSDAMKRGRPFDVVIMDLTVPGAVNGKDAVQELREVDPDLRAIAASGYHNDPVMADYREHGFMDALGKPFEISELLRVLSRVLADRPLPAEPGRSLT